MEAVLGKKEDTDEFALIDEMERISGVKNYISFYSEISPSLCEFYSGSLVSIAISSEIYFP